MGGAEGREKESGSTKATDLGEVMSYFEPIIGLGFCCCFLRFQSTLWGFLSYREENQSTFIFDEVWFTFFSIYSAEQRCSLAMVIGVRIKGVKLSD